MSDEKTADSSVEQGHPLATHLIELRKRLLRTVLIVLVIFISLFSFANDIYHIVATPLLASLPEGSQMIATEVASPFLTPFKLTLVVAIFIAMPFILFEIWGFIAPALYSHEKRLFIPVILFSIILFYAGIAFAYFVVFPLIFAFFSAAGPEGVAYTPDISQFLNTVLKLFFAFGLAFQIPIFTTVLIRTGATTPESLSNKRPYIIVGCFVAGMLLTPPDPVSQCLMALPMWLLFELGLFLGRFSKPKTISQEPTSTE
ncbi:MAG: twin-arginine translocase subunit TatC [Sinobacterium sp.]|nr:twin-arginine translocase subunit TatC [Sinobacterium sp.]